ncbi:hypothetical protein KY285_031357 [Solanum tuberosum]|nr:hypothetical protein KY284_031152 [Solanum tuberosum]KAH0656475.1 hypothetical protein KY285_031357 [Solanum tuberosum]
MVEPEKGLSHPWVKELGVPTLKSLIQWRRRPVEEASWENCDLLAVQYPFFASRTRHLFGGIPIHLSRRTSEETINKRLKV